ncbi:MAG TPA: hypothetical protein VMF06_00580 [Candidatus Limnocylindria bacterium]|nr:hypothetical protein [Candidatus Limnocylindria bacterium]
MKLPLLTAALVLASSLAQASVFDFGSLAAGSEANLAATDGVTFSYASLVPNTNGDGDPIGGSTWQLDPSSGPVLVQDPSLRGHGAGPNSLDAVDQPVAVVFPYPVTLELFYGYLDRGTLGGAPVPHELVFLADDKHVIYSTELDFGTPGAFFSVSHLYSVSEVILPSDKYYEMLAYVATPEMDGRVLAGVAALCGGWIIRRKSVKK